MVMRADAVKGQKIIFKNPLSGHTLDQRTARKSLNIDGVYTVERIAEDKLGIKVFLCEVPNIPFGIALFDNES